MTTSTPANTHPHPDAPALVENFVFHTVAGPQVTAVHRVREMCLRYRPATGHQAAGYDVELTVVGGTGRYVASLDEAAGQQVLAQGTLTALVAATLDAAEPDAFRPAALKTVGGPVRRRRALTADVLPREPRRPRA
jgi:hypothetical protein